MIKLKSENLKSWLWLNEIAVLHADESILRKHSLVADADIIRLKVMCRNNKQVSLADIKNGLKAIIENGKI